VASKKNNGGVTRLSWLMKAKKSGVAVAAHSIELWRRNRSGYVAAAYRGGASAAWRRNENIDGNSAVAQRRNGGSSCSKAKKA
jgi:hypothetical protein